MNKQSVYNTWQRISFVVTFYTGTLLPEILPFKKHWNEIINGLYLGALPIATQFAGRGNHGEKIIQQCHLQGRELGAVYSILNSFEIEGKGLGLKPVSPDFWKSKGVKHHLVPMDDFGGNIDIKKIKTIVDDMHKVISEGGSIYVHCKAGKGRSFSFIAAFLLLNTHLDVTQVLALIYKHRSQVSPSNAQLQLIERFRQAYCPHKAPLNTNSKYFQPYRKDWWHYGNNAIFHGLLASLLMTFVIGSPLVFGLAVGITTSILSTTFKSIFKHFNQASYRSVGKNTYELSKLSLDQLKALKAGIDSALSYKEWGKHLMDVPSTLHYRCYRAGVCLKQENKPVCNEVASLIEKKSRLRNA